VRKSGSSTSNVTESSARRQRPRRVYRKFRFDPVFQFPRSRANGTGGSQRREPLGATEGTVPLSRRNTLLGKLEGYTNEEIAAKIGRALPTVERRLRLIRQRWQGEMGIE
jgi:DNA-directed RNA polymerase specialized sigma24 family protein